MAKFTDEDGTTRLSGAFVGPIVVADATDLGISGESGNAGANFTAASGDINEISLTARAGNNFASVLLDGATQAVLLWSSAVIHRFANAAPPDELIANGGFALWLDATNGAAKLMVKAKSADGTVVTGSLNLS